MNDTHPNDEKTVQNIRRLIWLYFWLLLFEGALRKWALPQLSNPLLIIRDPVVIAAYFLALKAHVFPSNKWVYALGIIGGLSFAVSILQLWPYIPPKAILLVTGYGFRANFLHLPMIFLMARVLRAEDVKRIGWWALVLLVPMSMLLVAQFRAAPDAFLNRTVGGEGEMMTSALGKVRTAGTFSFVIGVVAYFALSTAFLVWAALRRDVYKPWLLFAAGAALAIGIAVSGSRSVVGACVVVVASLAVVLFLRPKAVGRFGQTLLITVVLGFVVMQTPIFKEGFNVLSTRFAEAAEGTDKSVGAGLVERVFEEFTQGIFVLSKAPFLGYGLGIGTNAGAKFLTGRQMFLLSEGEWPRIFLESGQVLGLAYVIWRCAIVVSIGLLCIRAVKAGNILPILIFSSGCLPMLTGQFGQPTILGFAVFALGMAMAAQKMDAADTEPSGPGDLRPVAQPVRRIPRRSEYAARLHGTPTSGGQTNGANHHP
jgi:hypothetical protein